MGQWNIGVNGPNGSDGRVFAQTAPKILYNLALSSYVFLFKIL